MSMDLSEFHDIFFEECNEGLVVMETGLLTLDNGTDVEEINSIFRAAHSIKGGAGSFGFMDISEFTHLMETLLDEMRDGRREVTQNIVDLLLKSVDILRDMVTAAQEEDEVDSNTVAEVKASLDKMLESNEGKGSTEDTDVEEEIEADCSKEVQQEALADEKQPQLSDSTKDWKIYFKPNAEMMKGGNDPIRIFRELDSLGDLKVSSDLSGIVDLDEIDPEQSYISWHLELRDSENKEAIQEAFSWVEGECILEISPLNNLPGNTETTMEAVNSSLIDEKQPSNPTKVEDPSSENTADKPIEKRPAKISPPNSKTDEASKTKPPAKSKSGGAKESGSIRVSIDKVDALINMVGELVITQSMLSQTGESLNLEDTTSYDRLLDGLTQLERNTRELQENVLQIRMLPISFAFSRFPRLVRDLSKNLGKIINIEMIGENTEVDKTVLEKINDPLVHLVRNSLDHGIETPEVRRSKGKPENGTLQLRAYHEGSDIVIQVSDDGAGLNRDVILNKAIEKGLVGPNEELPDDRIANLIFMPGFSTAAQLTDVSGRGVGMDVVRRNVRDLGGNVSISNNVGRAGSTVTIRLPLTLAILDGQLVRVGDETYIVSLIAILESMQMSSEYINTIANESEVYRLRDEYLPVIRLKELFEVGSGTDNLQEGLLVVVESDGRKVGLFVDDLLGQQQVVIKNLESNFKQIQGISGATILGDGTVALIMDVPGLIQKHFESKRGKGGGQHKHAAAA